MRKISGKQKERNKGKGERTKKLHDLFREIWDEREDERGYCYCYETNRELPGFTFRSNTCCFHHLLPKSKYPELEFCKENIVILHPDIHSQVEKDIKKCPKVEKLLNRVKEHFNI